MLDARPAFREFVMPIEIACPDCDHNYFLRDSLAGKRFQCKHCESVVSVPEGASKRASTPKATRNGTRRRRATGQTAKSSEAEPRTKRTTQRRRREGGSERRSRVAAKSQKQEKERPFLLDLEVVEDDNSAYDLIDDTPKQQARPRARARTTSGQQGAGRKKSKSRKNSKSSSGSSEMMGAAIVAAITLGGMAIGAVMLMSRGDDAESEAADVSDAVASVTTSPTTEPMDIEPSGVSATASPAPTPVHRPTETVTPYARELARRIMDNTSAFRDVLQTGQKISRTARSGSDAYVGWNRLLIPLNRIKAEGELLAQELQGHANNLTDSQRFTGAAALRAEVDAGWLADLKAIEQIVRVQRDSPWSQLSNWHKQMLQQRDAFWGLFR